jgi:FAD/FMN-containing dehydrogenase
MIYAGLLAYGLPQGEDVMNAYTELAVNAPDELGTCAAMVTAPDAPFVPPEAHGHPVIAVIYAYFGDHAEGERLTQGLRAVGPVVDLVQPMPYRGFQTLVDALNPPGNRNYWRGELLSGLTDGVVDTFLRFPTEGLHPLSALLLFQHGGAVSRVPDDATAISGRDATFMLHPIGAWEDPAEDEKHIAWVRGVSSAMEPFKTGGVYLNFMADEDQARAGFGDAKYARLAAVKREYDPENVFRFNQNIQPA